MAHTLVDPHSTKTGFGIIQRSNGNLAAIYKCCSRTAIPDGKCRGCGQDLRPFSTRGAAVSTDITPTMHASVLETWVSSLVGAPVSVEFITP